MDRDPMTERTVKSSFVPGLQIRNRRDLVRTLSYLIQIRTRHKNRIHKIIVRAGN
jgi:hypothetical protein